MHSTVHNHAVNLERITDVDELSFDFAAGVVPWVTRLMEIVDAGASEMERDHDIGGAFDVRIIDGGYEIEADEGGSSILC